MWIGSYFSVRTCLIYQSPCRGPNSNNFKNYSNWIEFGWNETGPTITMLLEIDTKWIGEANSQRTLKPFSPFVLLSISNNHYQFQTDIIAFFISRFFFFLAFIGVLSNMTLFSRILYIQKNTIVHSSESNERLHFSPWVRNEPYIFLQTSKMSISFKNLEQSQKEYFDFLMTHCICT